MKTLDALVVVYAEDDVALRTFISDYLKRRIKVIHEANNGEEGLKLIEEHNPDVVITDIEMPVMNGLTMIERIRDRYNGTKPIIVITAYKDDEHFTDSADAYLYKPLDMKELVAKIEELVNRPR